MTHRRGPLKVRERNGVFLEKEERGTAGVRRGKARQKEKQSRLAAGASEGQAGAEAWKVVPIKDRGLLRVYLCSGAPRRLKKVLGGVGGV